MSTTASNESHSRQRVSRACDLCRRKKVKCDGATPVCTNCKAIGLECTFKDTTKKRGPPKGYIEAVENRLYKLENYLVELSKSGDIQSNNILKELNSPLETPTGEQIRERPVRRVPKSERNKVFFWQQDQAGKKKRESLWLDEPDQSSREEDSPADEGIGQLSMDANGQMRYLGKSSGYYLLQSSRTYQNGAFHFANYGKRRKRRHNPRQVDPFELPPKDLSEHLIVLYFQHFYPFLPLFFQRRLFSSVEQEVTPLLLNSIYAVASRISDDVRVRSDPAVPDTAGDVFFERAEKLLDESYDKPSISTVQSLLLLASHQHGAMRSARAWLYSGMAFRMAQDLGLHRNCDYWNLPPEECERRKRVFWCCYVVDRLGSAMYGRATTFEERDCDVPFPSVDDDETLPSVAEGQPIRILDNFINLIKICDILGHVLKNIYYVRSLQNTGAKQADSVLNILNKRLQQWHDQLPSSLRIQAKSSPSVAVCQLHMIYYTTLILLHRPFTRGPDQTVSIPSLLPSASILASAADSMLSILDQMFEHNQLVYVLNFSVYYIFTVGLIFVRDASNHEEPAESKLNKCMEALNKIETTWITASKNCQILAELAGYHHPETGVLWSEDSKDRWIDFSLDPQSAPITTTLDPFEAPDIIPIKPFGYWESSLDDWNPLSHQEDAHQKGQHLIHTDQHVDVLTGVSLDVSDKSNEKSFMDYLQNRSMNQQTPEDGGPSVIKDLANAYYW